METPNTQAFLERIFCSLEWKLPFPSITDLQKTVCYLSANQCTGYITNVILKETNKQHSGEQKKKQTNKKTTNSINYEEISVVLPDGEMFPSMFRIWEIYSKLHSLENAV